MQTFETFASKYYERGYVTIPVAGKRPIIKEWTKWHTKRPTEADLERWCGLNATGISFVCGPVNGICGLDIDTDNKQVIDIIQEIVPPSPIVKKGAKGFNAFYRFDYKGDEPVEHKFKVAGEHVAEVLLKKHTILPPSPHPDKKHLYKWLTDINFLNDMFDLDDLPYLTWDMIHNVDAALGSLGSTAPSSTIIQGGKPGRNHYLTAVVGRLINSRASIDESVSTLIKEDYLMHKKNPLFEDRTENGTGCDPVVNALRFYQSHFTSIANFRRSKSEPVEYPVTLGHVQKEVKSSPNLGTGFFMEGKKGNKIPLYHELSDFLITKHHIYSHEGYVRMWNGTHYGTIGKRELAHMVDKYTKYQCVGLNQKNMFSGMTIDTAFNREQFLLDTKGYINLENGRLDVSRKLLEEHDPAYHFRYVLGYAYNPNARCPRFLKFLSDVFEGNQATVSLIREFIAYTLLGGNPFLHKALCLVGSGRNGKSTLIEIMKALLGQDNVSSVSLSRIDEPFHAVGLDGKLANLLEELPVDVISPEAFKNIIGGGDVGMCKKFQDVYFKAITARFIFATNDMPKFKDASAGLHERIIFVEFPRYFSEREREGNLSAKIISSELPGILNWVLELLPMDDSFKLTIPASSVALKEDFIEESNSVVAWFKEQVVFNEHRVNEMLPLSELFIRYQNWCGHQGVPAAGNKTFVKRVKEHIKRLVSESESLDYKGVVLRKAQGWCVKCIRLTV